MKSALQPTLWRTCRVLANRKRLQIFRLLLDHPGLSVSTVASRLHIGVPLASEHLRALNARSFLAPRRTSRWVQYYPAEVHPNEAVQSLAAALQATFRKSRKPVESVFRLVTAFTHRRRTDILRALKDRPHSLGQLMSLTGVPRSALLRHLRKLEARGFIAHQPQRRRLYRALNHHDPFGRALASLC